MICGSSIAGSRRSYLGTLKDLDVTPVGYDAVVIDWNVDQLQAINCLVAIYCDGRLQALAPSDGTASISNLGDGTHTLTARLVGQDSNASSRVWHLGAQRVWLKWRPDTVPDLASYVVQLYDAGEDEWNDVAEITRRAVGELNKKKPTTGTGSGRLTVFGTVNSSMSGTISLVVNGSNLDLVRDSVVVESREIVPQATLVFSSGMRVYVVDSAELYVTGDTWTTTVGIDCNWQSNVLAPGDYTYKVLAVDAVGNRSTAVGQFLVTIQALPEKATAPVIELEEDGPDRFEIDLNFVDGLTTDGSVIEVYSNYNVALDRYEDAIYTRSPLAIITAPLQTLIESAPLGLLKLYLWTRKDGVLRDDLTIYSTHIPPTAQDDGVKLGTIISLSLTYLPDGTPRASWTYDFSPLASDTTSFDVLFQINSSSPDWGSSSNYATSANVVEQSGSFVSYSVDGGTPAVTGDTLYVWVRPRADAYDATGGASSASTGVDIDPPPAPVVEIAMPS